ncbi:UNVERIFIED_CONTAM: Sodium/hydrogen exchanger 5 [Trichonephila clavipes]
MTVDVKITSLQGHFPDKTKRFKQVPDMVLIFRGSVVLPVWLGSNRTRPPPWTAFFQWKSRLVHHFTENVEGFDKITDFHQENDLEERRIKLIILFPIRVLINCIYDFQSKSNGATIKPLVKLLKIRRQTVKNTSMFTEVNTKLLDHVMAGVEEVTGDHGGNYWKCRCV